jgi:hypothetical protein
MLKGLDSRTTGGSSTIPPHLSESYIGDYVEYVVDIAIRGDHEPPRPASARRIASTGESAHCRSILRIYRLRAAAGQRDRLGVRSRRGDHQRGIAPAGLGRGEPDLDGAGAPAAMS